MCWSASVSLNTYIFGLFASTFAYYNNIITLTGFIFYQSFIIVQLIEYFIWSKTFSNSLLSKIALIAIISQPFFSILKIKSRTYLIPYLLSAYVLFIIILYTFITPLHTINFSSIPSKNGHLSWKWLANWYSYILLIWYMFLSLYWIIEKEYITFIIVSILLIITIILYKDTQTWGSMWCWICNIISFYLIYKVFYKELCKI